MIISFLIVLAVAGGVVMGYRRGFVRVGLEVATLIVATLAAWPLAGLLVPVLGGPLGVARAFTYSYAAIWVVLGVAIALLVRALAATRLEGVALVGGVDRPLAGILNGVKTTAVVVALITAYAALPLSQSALDIVTDSPVPRAIIARTAPLQEWWESVPGAALSQTVTRYVISSDPESSERVELDFTTTAGVPAPALETKMLALVNRERTARGLSALSINPAAQTVARQYALTMLSQGFFSHIDNDKHNPFDRLRAGGVKFGAAGENLALAANLHRAHVGLMQSPGHRANILSDNYSTIGIGIIDAGSYGVMVVQEFTD